MRSAGLHSGVQDSGQPGRSVERVQRVPAVMGERDRQPVEKAAVIGQPRDEWVAVMCTGTPNSAVASMRRSNAGSAAAVAS